MHLASGVATREAPPGDRLQLAASVALRILLIDQNGERRATVEQALRAAGDEVIAPGPGPDSLLARMRALLRRSSGSAQSLLGAGAALQLDLNTREAVRGGQRESLTAREFALLRALLERPGAILSREQLEQRIYGWGEEVCSNAVDVLIHGMRRKLGLDAIRNVRGLGWRVPRVDASP